MKALILKDILTLGKQSKMLLIIIAAYAVFGVAFGNIFFISGLPTMMLSLLTITSFSYDTAAKWDLFALSTPVSKKDLVAGKYVLTLIVVLAGSAFALILSLFYNTMHHTTSLIELLSSIGGCALAALFINTVLLPMVYKMGVEKARVAMVLAFVIPVAAVAILSSLGVALPPLSTEMGKALIIAIPVAIIALFFLSYRLSLSIFLKKES